MSEVTLNTRAEASSAEPEAWMYRRDGRNVILRERLHRDGVLQGVIGWTETPLYAHPPAAPDTVTLDRTLAERLMEYAGHADDCQIMTHGVWSDPIPCTCGYSGIATKLTEALK